MTAKSGGKRSPPSIPSPLRQYKHNWTGEDNAEADMKR